MNRSFTARLSRTTPRRLRDYLWATHRIFNESLAYLLKHYFWMQNLTDRTPEQDLRNQLRKRFNEAQLDRLRLVYRDMMGLDLPKDKRAGRSQAAQAWMEPITFSIGSTGPGPGASSKNIQPGVKQAIHAIRAGKLWLFDRELAFPVRPDNGFRRGLFGAAARRILNFEQNQETHKGYIEGAQRAFVRWAGGQDRTDGTEESVDTRRGGWRRTVLLRDWGRNQVDQREKEIDDISRLCWSNFKAVRAEFESYERQRGIERAKQQGRPVRNATTEKINAAMTRGWRDIYERLMPPDSNNPPDAAAAGAIIKAYQTAEPRRIGDINFFLWLADKPHLWRFVETMKVYSGHQRKLEQYRRDIQFRYPRYNQRPDWFTFSETSPGHMYTVISMSPLVIEFSVLVPEEDKDLLKRWADVQELERLQECGRPIPKKLSKTNPLTDDEFGFLDEPIDWDEYRLTPARLVERRHEYATALRKTAAKKALPDPISMYGLAQTHDWTNTVWEQLMSGFLREDPPLDLSRFTRVMVRYSLSTDVRLQPFVQDPADDQHALGRLVVASDERQEPHWQGTYEYWYGPLASPAGLPAERRRHLRLLPLVIGGIRLEYRGRLRADANPIFTLSCELDERIKETDGKRVNPAPKHRIRSSKIGRPLKRGGWDEPDSNTIVCRFHEGKKMAVVGEQGPDGIPDEHPAPGVRLVLGRKKPTPKITNPYPTVVEAWFDRTCGWERKPPGVSESDSGRYVEDWIAESGARSIDPGTRVLAIDLGMRHLGTGVVVGFVDDGSGNGKIPDPLTPLAVAFLDAPGIGLVHIERHARERRSKQRKACPRGPRRPFEVRGAHLPRGQQFARALLEHAENLKDDRRKKAANAIVCAGLEHKVDYIVFENLKGYRPDFEFGRRVNAALMNWNRRELVEFVKMEAAPHGIHVRDSVPAHHTSRFCHRCGSPGYRFSEITQRQASMDALAPQEPVLDEQGNQKLDAKGKPLFRRRRTPDARRARGTPLGLIAGLRQAIDGGKHFCCGNPECGLMVNADYNAAMNLVRKLAGEFAAYQRYSYNQSDRSWVLNARRFASKPFWEQIKGDVQQRLNDRFNQPTDTAPAGGWPKDFRPRATADAPW